MKPKLPWRLRKANRRFHRAATRFGKTVGIVQNAPETDEEFANRVERYFAKIL